ncbi:MAG: RNA polymerase factor sigma-32 [Myxococcota bacterium]
MPTGKKKTTKKTNRKKAKNKNLPAISDNQEEFIEVEEEELEDEEEEELLLEVEEEKEDKELDEAINFKYFESNLLGDSSKIVKYDPLKAYIQQIRNYPLLSQEEEKEVAKKYNETSNGYYAKKLITSNLRLVVKIAHEYSKSYTNLIDLVQEGNIGLVKAVEKFDPYRGVKLSTYSSWWIRAYILKYLLNNWRLVKVGTTQAQRKLFFNLNKQTQQLKAKGIDPTNKKIAHALDVPEYEVNEMRKRMSASDLSLSTPIGGEEGDTGEIIDLMPNDSKTPEKIIDEYTSHKLIRQKIKEFAKTLEERDLFILNNRLLSTAPYTLKKIGEHYGISRERARQLEKRIKKNLRQFISDEIGDKIDPAQLELSDEETMTADEVQEIIKDKLTDFATNLTGSKKVIMRERILADNPLTIKKLSNRYSIKPSKIREIELGLMKELRNYLLKELGDNVYIALGDK